MLFCFRLGCSLIFFYWGSCQGALKGAMAHFFNTWSKIQHFVTIFSRFQLPFSVCEKDNTNLKLLVLNKIMNFFKVCLLSPNFPSLGSY